MTQLVDGEPDAEDARQYRRIERDSIFEAALDFDGYHFGGTALSPESGVSTFSRPTSSRMRPNPLSMYPNRGESLIPLVILTIAPEYYSASRILAGETCRREEHEAFGPHLCDVGQSRNGEGEQRDEHQQAPVMIMDDVPYRACDDDNEYGPHNQLIMALLAPNHRCPQFNRALQAVISRSPIVTQRKPRDAATFG
ncbi:MAG: hypothetical protein ABIZ05_12150 [Pseudonocardiaceae bacterium]